MKINLTFFAFALLTFVGAAAIAHAAEDASSTELAIATDAVEPAACDELACSCETHCCDGVVCGDPAGRQPFWYAGTEMTFLNLDATTGGRITASFSDTTAPGVSTISFRDGDGLNNHFAYAPRVWLGRQFNEKWGIVGRFWDMSDNVHGSPTVSPGTTPTGTNFATFEETDRAHLYTIDLEGTRSGQVGKWKIDGTLGARHASMGADSDFLGFGVFTTGNFVNLTLQNGCSFDGTGGTGSITLRRQLGESPLTFFLSGRTSYLGGFTNSFGRSDGSVASSPSSPLVGAATVTRHHAEAELDINEFQAGLQLDFQLRELPVSAFFRAAVEYQNWDIDGRPTGGAGFGGTIGELTTNSFASAGLGGAHLVGLALATGFTY